MLVTALRIALAIAAAINVYGCWSMNKRMAGISKVFLMPLVIAIYLAAIARRDGAVTGAALSIPLLLGMLCGYAGDLFLLKDSLFTAGLAAFLCGHIFYIIAFAKDIVWRPQTALLLLVVVLYIIYIFWLKRHLIPFVPKKMKAPVFVYMGAIVAMSVAAFLRFSAVGSGMSAEYIFYTFLGSVLFVASDSILAMTVFKRDVGSFMEVGVMITYVFAQFLIMWGMK